MVNPVADLETGWRGGDKKHEMYTRDPCEQKVAGSNNAFGYKYFCHFIQWIRLGKTALLICASSGLSQFFIYLRV